MTVPNITLPAGFQLLANADGSFSVAPAASSNIASAAISGLHSALADGGAQIPTALAVPVTAALAPNAVASAINVAGDIASGNYVNAAMTGIPLLLGAISAAYAVFTPSQEPTDAQIKTYVSTLSRNQLVGLLNADPANPGAATANRAAAPGASEQPQVQPVAAAV